MRLIKHTCSKCNAQLDIDLDHLQAFCPYCGQKLLFDFDQLSNVLSEKEKTKRTATREEAQTKRVQMAYEHESREKDKDWKKKVISSIGIALVCLLAVYFLAHIIGSAIKKHDEKVAYLQQIEIEVDGAIQAGDFDTALLMANKLYCDDHWSSEETAAWDAKREAYIEIIQGKKREADIKNPNNIFMSSPSSTLEGKNYNDVKDIFLSLGFSNISTQIATKSPGWFDKENTVEHILIGGKTKFTTEDYFDKDTQIIIYYYQK